MRIEMKNAIKNIFAIGLGFVGVITGLFVGTQNFTATEPTIEGFLTGLIIVAIISIPASIMYGFDFKEIQK